MTPARRFLSFVLRAGLLVLVALAMTEPRWVRQQQSAHVFWIVDRSHSVGDGALAAARKFTAPGTSYGRHIDSQGWIGFAAQPAVAPDLQTLSNLPLRTLDENATDLAGALAFADATFLGDRVRRTLRLPDGAILRASGRPGDSGVSPGLETRVGFAPDAAVILPA